ncbi:YlzJ-like family protein [Paenibacillus sp. D2_2]|uniref:YlzJ-like family protein n=1 Tax=Paenibacillus sp. D2_2 TaxID=3073092 RepID=UPI002816821A|nr:YlzJ-like family protein [Paenibacillus sp. D2_2]WMT39146.1 YlzJ-like family protein [Paenibacillus sp. D2_2]
MTHYTIIPEEEYWAQPEVEQMYSEVEMGGLLMQVRMEPGNRATIIRLLRCNLEDYLNPLLAPGSKFYICQC